MFYENFKCGTARNYSDYCDEQMDKMIDGAVIGARSREAPEARARHPEEARGGRGASDCWAGARNTSPTGRT
jgi:hypothetical protein